MKITIKKIPKDFRPETKKHTFRLTEKESKRLTRLADIYCGGVKTDLLKLLINNAVFEDKGVVSIEGVKDKEIDYSEFLGLAVKISEEKGHDVFIEYSPHVRWMAVRVFLGGWDVEKKPDYDTYFYLSEVGRARSILTQLRGLL